MQDSIIKEEISAGHARALINLPNARVQIELMHKIIDENLSVRKVENLVKRYITGNLGNKKPRVTHSTRRMQNLSQKDLEDKLRKIFGTKVSCKIKANGSGELVIEFYSNEELDRLFEMFEIIGKTYN